MRKEFSMAHATSHAHDGAGHGGHSAHEHDAHGGHGGHGGHDSHVIIGPFQLRAVLGILLFFTALTVGLAQVEVFVAGFFDVVLPWWVNVAVAMSIAVVKTLLVMAIFMQLRYDNPINSILMAFCFFALFLFLFFSGLDLFTRDRIYDFKAGQVAAGGTQSPVKAAREAAIEKWGPEKFEKLYKERKKGHGHDGHHAVTTVSSPNQSRSLIGSTGALDATDAHGHDDHGHSDDHGDAAAKPKAESAH
jgi:caa(3)-type oxidase subunit IV